MDQIHKRRTAITGPVAIPKKLLRKYSLYLPKPAPPKLPVREYPNRRGSDEWTEKMEPQEERSQEETPGTIPETERDWFPNVEYQEQPPDEDGEQKQQEQWDSLWESQEEEEWEQWEQEQEQEAEEISAQHNAEAERDEIEQGQQDVEEEWPQAKDEESHEGHNSDELEMEEEWPEEEADNDWEGEPYPQEEEAVSNKGENPIPAPKLRPVSSKPKPTGPMFVPLNKGKGQPNKGAGKPFTDYPTPLTHPVIAQNPHGCDKGAKGKKATWTHPIQDPFHPVHMGRGRVVQSEVPNQWMTYQKGEWAPPPFPGQYQMAPFPYHPGYGQQTPYIDQGPGRMLPPWMQPGNRQPTDWIPEPGYDASEDTDDEESSQRTKTDKKVRKKPKNPNPKRRKYKIWITVNGKRQQASYWK